MNWTMRCEAGGNFARATYTASINLIMLFKLGRESFIAWWKRDKETKEERNRQRKQHTHESTRVVTCHLNQNQNQNREPPNTNVTWNCLRANANVSEYRNMLMKYCSYTHHMLHYAVQSQAMLNWMDEFDFDRFNSRSWVQCIYI